MLNLKIIFFKNLKAIEKDTRTLNQLVRENTNTKREIREIAIKLRSILSMITTVEMLNAVGKPITKQDVADEDTGKIDRKDGSTQTESITIMESGDTNKNDQDRKQQLIKTVI